MRYLLFFSFFWSVLAVADGPEGIFYPIQNGNGKAIAASVSSMLNGKGERVSHDAAGKRLRVIARPETHRLVAELIAALDRPLRNVQIQVYNNNATAARESAGSAHARAHRVANTLTSLVVAEGATGSIVIGQDVPYLEWLTTFGRNWAPPRDEFDIKWDKVGAFLTVTPRIGGSPAEPWIFLDLTPELRGLVKGEPFRVQYTRATTQVVAGNGRLIQIGGAADAAVFFQRFLARRSERGGQITSVNLSVRPTILQPPSPKGSVTPGMRKVDLTPRIPEIKLHRPPIPKVPKMRTRPRS